MTDAQASLTLKSIIRRTQRLLDEVDKAGLEYFSWSGLLVLVRQGWDPDKMDESLVYSFHGHVDGGDPTG